MSLLKQIGELRALFTEELREAKTSKDLENLKVKYLGKKGPVQALMQELKNSSPSDRPEHGRLINDLKEELLSHYENSLIRCKREEEAFRFEREALDVSLPGRRYNLGRKHPVQQMLTRVLDILVGMGFSVELGPDVDTDYYNFEALNFPLDHPARDLQDTFYLSEEFLLRTHTSNVQVRVMERDKPPIRIVAPGRCFRNEDISARSHVFFHQVEAVYIDHGVSFADLLGTMDLFLKKLLGEETEVRYRPSYFPFVEPGMEVDVRCTACKGSGCRICKRTGWLEILGAGMVHPNVLKKGGIDPEEFSGFAWGLGIERLSILEHDISDIRLFTENDVRFLKQFP